MFVLDTNVVSYIHRNDPIAQRYLERMVGRYAIISFQTYEELRYGALIGNWGQGRIERLLHHVFANYDVIGCSERLVIACAQLRADSRRRGRRLDTTDAWIAATAFLLNCPLLSHDRDFGGLSGLEVVSYR